MKRYLHCHWFNHTGLAGRCPLSPSGGGCWQDGWSWWWCQQEVCVTVDWAWITVQVRLNTADDSPPMSIWSKYCTMSGIIRHLVFFSYDDFWLFGSFSVIISTLVLTETSLQLITMEFSICQCFVLTQVMRLHHLVCNLESHHKPLGIRQT